VSETAAPRAGSEAPGPPARPPSVWRNGDFVKLWGGENVSLLGSTVTTIAIPFIAIPLLHATPAQVGALGASRFLPYLLVSLPAGVLIDRVPRRALMVFANLVRALLLLAIPVSAALHALHIEELYAISFAIGLFTVLFDLSWQAYLPSLVSREQLNAANSQLFAASNTIAVAGPGLAGVVVQALSAPVAVLADAASFVVGSLGLVTIRRHEGIASAPARRTPLAEIAEGFRLVFGNPYIRSIGLEATCSNVMGNFVNTVLLVYVVQQLGFTPTMLGAVAGGASIGSVLGSLTAGRLSSRLTPGQVVTGSMVVGCAFPLLLNAPGPGRVFFLAVFLLALAGSAFGIAISSVAVLTLRQAMTPPAVLGRMNAVYRMLVTGLIPVGPLLGGFAAQAAGVRTALLIGTVGWALVPLWVVLSPVPRLRSLDP
jgi:MFS family permease